MNTTTIATPTVHDVGDALDTLALICLDWAHQIGTYKADHAKELTFDQWQQLERAYTGLAGAASALTGISAVNRLKVVSAALDHIKAVTKSMGNAAAKLKQVNNAIGIATAALAFIASLSTGNIAGIASAAGAVVEAAKGVSQKP